MTIDSGRGEMEESKEKEKATERRRRRKGSAEGGPTYSAVAAAMEIRSPACKAKPVKGAGAKAEASEKLTQE